MSNLLCSLKSKYGKVSAKALKSSIVDFYKVEDLAAAKRQLISDIECLQLVQLPRIPDRRGGDVQAVRIVDELFNVFMIYHAMYVADSPDSMPSVRLYDGDLAVLMALLDKTDDRITGHDSVLAAIASDLCTVQVTARVSGAGQVLSPVINNDG